jgi:hypothetical protein
LRLQESFSIGGDDGDEPGLQERAHALIRIDSGRRTG